MCSMMDDNSEARNWQAEWEHLYYQMDRENRLAMFRLIHSRLQRERQKRLTFRWLRLRETPPPVRLSFLHAMLTFAGLIFMPRHPITIPTVLGISLVVVIYLQALSLRLAVLHNR